MGKDGTSRLGHHLWPVLGQWKIIVFSDEGEKYGASFEITEENMNYMKPTPAEGIEVIENPDGALTVNATIPVYEPVAGGDGVGVVFRVFEDDDDIVFEERWHNPTGQIFQSKCRQYLKGTTLGLKPESTAHFGQDMTLAHVQCNWVE